MSVYVCQLPGMVKSDQLARAKEVNLTLLHPPTITSHPPYVNARFMP